MSTDTEYQLRLGKIQYDRQETGSRNNYARIIDRNVISKANTMFSRAADTMDRRHDGSTTDTEYQLHLL